MSDLPAPLTDKMCNLQGIDWMPMLGHRFYQSDLYTLALSSPRAGMAAQKLWWTAWQQCPAGSLPSDDRALARHADFGGDLRAWMRCKEVALHGFVLCSDGRLYHPMLCELAMKAAARRAKETLRKRQQRENSAPERANDAATRIDDAGEPQIYANSAVVELDNELKDKELLLYVPRDRAWDGARKSRGDEIREEERTELRSDAFASVKVSKPLPARDRLWGEGLCLISDLTGMPKQRCRSLVGKWLRTMKDDCAGLLAILDDAQEVRPIDPIPWMEAAVSNRLNHKGHGAKLAEELGFEPDFMSIFTDPQPTPNVVTFPENRRLA